MRDNKGGKPESISRSSSDPTELNIPGSISDLSSDAGPDLGTEDKQTRTWSSVMKVMELFYHFTNKQ